MARDLQGVERILNRQKRLYDHRDLLLSNYITPEMRRLAQGVTVKDWPVSRILDQGNTGHCVGFAWAHFGIAVPVPDDWQNQKGHDIYYAAKIFDGEPNQEDGSSTLSGVKAFMQFGSLSGNGYAWAQSIDDIAVYVSTTGPVVTGIDWYYDMMNPDSAGFLHPSGGLAGGHEILISGVNKDLEELHFTNSWSDLWGKRGTAKIKNADYQFLFNSQGDCCTALEVSAVPVPPDPTPVPDPNNPGCLAQIKKMLFG